MSDLEDRFRQSAVDVKSLPSKPDSLTLLRLYALFKQASSGDADGERPGLGDMVGRAKWDAWNALKGQRREEAMQSYVDLVASLQA